MQKAIHVDCPTYVEIQLQNGEVTSLNGKSFTHEGVENVIEYLCKEVDVKASDVFEKINTLSKKSGAVTLKLYNGGVNAI